MRATRRKVSSPRALRLALLRVPREKLDFKAVQQQLSTAVGSAGSSAPGSIIGALHAAAIRTVGERQREDLLQPILEQARGSAGGGWLAYTAALGVVSRSQAPDRLERATSLVGQMRADGCKPSQLVLQHLFRAARASEDPMDSMIGQMKLGTSPKIAAFNSLIGAYVAAAQERRLSGSVLAEIAAKPSASGAGGPSKGAAVSAPGASAAQKADTASVSLLLSVMSMCKLKPNGATLQQLLALAKTPSDVAALEARHLHPGYTGGARGSHLAHAFLSAQARVSSRHAAEALMQYLVRREPPPSDASVLAVLRSCCAAGDPAAAHHIVNMMWERQLPLSDRAARALLLAAGESAAAGHAGADALLDELRSILVGDAGGRGSVQRGTARRGDAAAHELARALAIAEWRAGRASVAAAMEGCLASLRRDGVPPRAVLVGTMAHMHASEGNVPAALRALRPPGGVAGVAPREGGFVAVLNTLRHASQLPDAMALLQAMAQAGAKPTLRTRIALAELVLRVRRSRGGPPGVPSGSQFWREARMPVQELDETLAQFAAHDVDAAAVADLVLEARCAALLERIARLMSKGQADG